ncbi:MAG: MaoC/PaaZ C-terminal domain-containing protein [Rhodocyclaceae bacterium]|jgi:acyl dehydratase|nr:MaoC/PaaZ C-terminal domain-containing protein [Rhodocyclaceae bacterium]
MALDYDRLMSLKDEGMEYSYDFKDSILYALSVGMARDPVNAQELRFAFEGVEAQKTLPSLATVVSQGKPLPDNSCGWDFTKVLHAEQRLTVFRPIPAEAHIVVSQRVKDAYDRGEGKGAIILTEVEARLKNTGELLYRLGNTIFARGDGGFGGPEGSGPKPHALPERAPDTSFEVVTTPNQALFYRLLGDLNYLHADPAIATRAGFERPILHGRCVFGIACYSVTAAACDYDASRIREFNARFSSVTYPGETVVTDIWVDGDVISFRCRLKERDVVVLNNGYCRLA